MKIIYCDGFTIKSNPSQIGGGYVLVNEYGGSLIEYWIEKPKFTNNEAELLALDKALDLIEKGGTIYTDSSTAYYWVMGGYCRARPDLNSIASNCKEKCSEKRCIISLISRSKNKAGNYIQNHKSKFNKL